MKYFLNDSNAFNNQASPITVTQIRLFSTFALVERNSWRRVLHTKSFNFNLYSLDEILSAAQVYLFYLDIGQRKMGTFLLIWS